VNYRADNSAALAHGLAVGISALRKFRPIEVVITRNGEQKEERIAQLFAANLPFYGFGLHVAPGAEPDDGQLELVTMEAQTRRALLRMIPHLRRGTHVGRRGVSVARASRVRIDPRGSSPVVADSTDLGSGPVELTVLPQALQVVTP
jgi:diacylglycerol kinase (ATP)